MYIDISKNASLNEVWSKIISRLGNDAQNICSNSSSFYRTQDGMECSLRTIKGELIGICYREKNRTNGYRWTIEKNTSDFS